MNNKIWTTLFFIFCFFFCSRFVFGQQGVISYKVKSHGKVVKRNHPIQLVVNNNIAYLVTKNNNKTQKFINFSKRAIFETIHTRGKYFTQKKAFDSLQQLQFLEDTATIAGFLCHKAHLVIRSNQIDIWYTTDSPLKGSPITNIAPYQGLVLKIVRNGNHEIFATKVSSGIPDSLSSSPIIGQIVNNATFYALLIKSRYTSIPIFTDQVINFGADHKNPEGHQFSKIYHFSGGTIIAKRVHLPKNFHGNIFASITQYSNGDAYDRTGSVFVIPTSDKITFLDALEKGIKVLPRYTDNDSNEYQGIIKTAEYTPPVELIRFYTPFGVNAYNNKVKINGYHWADSVTYVQDVTHLSPLLQGDVWIGAYIGNYDKKGHTVSLKLNYYPGKQDSTHRWVSSIFNTLNILEMSGQNYGRLFRNDSLSVRVFIPDSIKNLRLRYISTGHGGWGGGDEFNPKLNTLLIDGQKVFSYIPWRTDCATYRLENPSSGNFTNGLSSSDFSRSGWCPGTTTNPVFIPLPHLKPGWHTSTIAIPQGAPEGNSYSFWNVSGVLLGEPE